MKSWYPWKSRKAVIPIFFLQLKHLYEFSNDRSHPFPHSHCPASDSSLAFCTLNKKQAPLCGQHRLAVVSLNLIS